VTGENGWSINGSRAPETAYAGDTATVSPGTPSQPNRMVKAGYYALDKHTHSRTRDDPASTTTTRIFNFMKNFCLQTYLDLTISRTTLLPQQEGAIGDTSIRRAFTLQKEAEPNILRLVAGSFDNCGQFRSRQTAVRLQHKDWFLKRTTR